MGDLGDHPCVGLLFPLVAIENPLDGVSVPLESTVSLNSPMKFIYEDCNSFNCARATEGRRRSHLSNQSAMPTEYMPQRYVVLYLMDGIPYQYRSINMPAVEDALFIRNKRPRIRRLHKSPKRTSSVTGK